MPKFNSNDVYMVFQQQHDHSVLGDLPYTFFKAFFWVGSRSLNHQAKIEKAMAILDELVQALPEGKVKLRIWIEYQYAESFEFFTLFDKIERLEALQEAEPVNCILKPFYAL